MRRLRRFRELLHRRYLRAVIVALALAAAVGAAATVLLEMRYEVPGRAVVRYFGRLHSEADDLRPLLRQPTTLAALEELSFVHAGMNRGGLVYSDDTGLSFYPWVPTDGAAAAELHHGEHRRIYHRLLARYLGAELDGLLADLAHPQTRRSLGRLGISTAPVAELQRLADGDPPPIQRLQLLRRAARLIRPFMPSGAERYQLELADKLRFYADRAPRGRYVGLFEVRGAGWLARPAPEALPTAGRRLTITKQPDGRILVEDLRPSGRRVYRLTPVPHPAGLPLYRL